MTSLSGAISSSSQLTSSYDTRYSLSGSILTSFSTSVDSRLDTLETLNQTYTGSISGSFTGSGYVDYLIFNSSSTATLQNYMLQANTTDKTLDLKMGNNATLQLGQEMYFPPIVNKSAVDLNDGDLVMVNPAGIAQGNRISVVKAIANGTYPADKLVGVLTEDVANNAEGFATWFGYVRNISKTHVQPAGETWVEGDVLYANPTIAGKLTNVFPTAPNLRVTVATITAINGNNVTILVNFHKRTALKRAHDVLDNSTTSSYGDLLIKSGSVWTNKTPTQIGMATTGSNLFIADQTISGSIIPAVSGAYDLGSISNPWRHIYVNTGSIFLVKDAQIVKVLNTNTIVTTTDIASGSVNLSTTLPIGVVSGSAQITSLGFVSGSYLTSLSGAISSSSQLTASLNTLYAASGSVGSNINTSSFATTGSNSFNGNQTITGSLIVSAVAVVNGGVTIPTGSTITLTSGSSISVDVSGAITGSLTGSVFGIGDVVAFSSSVNSRINNITSSTIPDGTISGSAQITTLGFISSSTTINTGSFATTGSNVFTGSQNIISGSVTASAFLGTIRATNGVVSGSSQVLGGSGVYSGSLYAAGARFSLQDIVIGVGTTQGIITTDNKPIWIRPGGITSNTIATFWNGGTGGLTIGNIPVGSVFTYAGLALDVSGSTRYTGNISVTGSVFSSNGFTGSIAATNGVISGSSQITTLGFISSSTPLTSLNTFTASNDNTSLNAATSSYETTGRNIVSGSSQLTSSYDSRYTLSGSVVSGTTPAGTISGSSQLTSSFDGRYTQTGSFNTLTASFNSFTASAQSVTTGSNSFNGTQTITGSLIITTGSFVASQILANTASLYLTSGSNLYVQNNGVVEITGSLIVSGSTTLKVPVLYVGTGSSVEGGEIDLAYAQSGNTTLTGSAIVFDIWQDRVRIFENGGTNRGGYFDISTLAAGVGTDLGKLTYLIEAYANVSYTLPGSYTNDVCRYSVVSNNVNVPTSWFNTSTYTFTPLKAGYWEIIASYDVYRNGEASLIIQKNGTSVAQAGAISSVVQQITKIIYLNGSTDYINVYNSGVNSNARTQSSANAFFQARYVGA